MPDPEIDEAISCLEASRAGHSAVGTSVSRTLRAYFKKDDIAFDPLSPKLYGSSVSYNLIGKSIKVNEAYRGDVAAMRKPDHGANRDL